MSSYKEPLLIKKKRLVRKKGSNKNKPQLWQIIFFNTISATLIFFLVKTGWEPINSRNIIVIGNSNFNRAEILRASGILLPKPLLTFIPKQIEVNLIRKLSLREVSIRRQIFPKKIFIEVLERKPIAYAQRKAPKGLENGMVDASAEWIPLNWTEKDSSKINLSITGWRESHRDLISLILINREELGSPLTEINLSSTGEISLQTEDFKLIKLGSDPNLLIQQIKILSHLNRSLPNRFVNKSRTTIDLRDPSKPELQTGITY